MDFWPWKTDQDIYLQWDGGEDKDDADQAWAEARGGSERQPGTLPSQGGESQAGAGKHEAETQVRYH